MAAKGFVLLDGGLATELEAAGHRLNDPLWSAKVLLDDPEAVAAVHRAFLEAGADCISTATYQATFPGFRRRGMTRAQAEDVFLRAVELAVRARDEFWSEASESERAARPRPLVAASVGPYGAFLADGSEYRGGYGIGAAELDAFHRRRWQVLAASSADVIAAETLPCLAEVRVLARLAAETRSKPAWLSFCCRDRGLLAGGDASVAQAGAAAAESPGVFATGVNCTAPAHVPAAVAALAAATAKPVLAYPNAGGSYDAAAKRWDSTSADRFDWEDACRSWVRAGAVGVGGCCRADPSVIRRMGAALADRAPPASVSPELPGERSGR